MKYRKKPIVIEAEVVSELLKKVKHNWFALPGWVISAYESNAIVFHNEHIIIKTLEGNMKGDYDDYLIKGVAGEIYPCKPDIFEKTYEKVE